VFGARLARWCQSWTGCLRRGPRLALAGRGRRPQVGRGGAVRGVV